MVQLSDLISFQVIRLKLKIVKLSKYNKSKPNTITDKRRFG